MGANFHNLAFRVTLPEKRSGSRSGSRREPVGANFHNLAFRVTLPEKTMGAEVGAGGKQLPSPNGSLQASSKKQREPEREPVGVSMWERSGSQWELVGAGLQHIGVRHPHRHSCGERCIGRCPQRKFITFIGQRLASHLPMRGYKFGGFARSYWRLRKSGGQVQKAIRSTMDMLQLLHKSFAFSKPWAECHNV